MESSAMYTASNSRARAALRCSIEAGFGDAHFAAVALLQAAPRADVYVPYPLFAAREEVLERIRVYRNMLPMTRIVAHVPARRFESEKDVVSYLEQLRALDVNALLLVSGDDTAPRGPYDSSWSLLASQVLAGKGFVSMGFAGYPAVVHGPARVSDAHIASLLRKAREAERQHFEVEIVTQFSFSPEVVFRYVRLLRNCDLDHPVRVGVAGPVPARTLIRIAHACGVRFPLRVLGFWGSIALVAHLLRSRIHEVLIQEIESEGRKDPSLKMIPHLFAFSVEALASWLVQDERKRLRAR